MQLVVVAVFSLLWWAAALLLWWIAVRRLAFSIWKTAWHVTLALALADLLDTALAFVLASIISNGAYVEALVHHAGTAASSNLLLVLIRSPIRFLGSAMLIALGRRLPDRRSLTTAAILCAILSANAGAQAS